MNAEQFEPDFDPWLSEASDSEIQAEIQRRQAANTAQAAEAGDGHSGPPSPEEAARTAPDTGTAQSAPKPEVPDIDPSGPYAADQFYAELAKVGGLASGNRFNPGGGGDSSAPREVDTRTPDEVRADVEKASREATSREEFYAKLAATGDVADVTYHGGGHR